MINIAIALFFNINPNMVLHHCKYNAGSYFCETLTTDKRERKLDDGKVLKGHEYMLLRELETVLELQDDGCFLNVKTNELTNCP